VSEEILAGLNLLDGHSWLSEKGKLDALNYTGSLEEAACSRFLFRILILWKQPGGSSVTCFYHKVRVSYCPSSSLERLVISLKCSSSCCCYFPLLKQKQILCESDHGSCKPSCSRISCPQARDSKANFRSSRRLSGLVVSCTDWLNT
jgi:hypothetical protein